MLYRVTIHLECSLHPSKHRGAIIDVFAKCKSHRWSKEVNRSILMFALSAINRAIIHEHYCQRQWSGQILQHLDHCFFAFRINPLSKNSKVFYPVHVCRDGWIILTVRMMVYYILDGEFLTLHQSSALYETNLPKKVISLCRAMGQFQPIRPLLRVLNNATISESAGYQDLTIYIALPHPSLHSHLYRRY